MSTVLDRIQPVNLSRPSKENVLQAMELLGECGIPQTTDNIRIALEELHYFWREAAGSR